MVSRSFGCFHSCPGECRRALGGGSEGMRGGVQTSVGMPYRVAKGTWEEGRKGKRFGGA